MGILAFLGFESARQEAIRKFDEATAKADAIDQKRKVVDLIIEPIVSTILSVEKALAEKGSAADLRTMMSPEMALRLENADAEYRKALGLPAFQTVPLSSGFRGTVLGVNCFVDDSMASGFVLQVSPK